MPYAECHKAVGLEHLLHPIFAVIHTIRVPPFRVFRVLKLFAIIRAICVPHSVIIRAFRVIRVLFLIHSHCHTAEPADMPIPGDGMRMEAERRQGMPCLYMSTSSAISNAPFRGLGVNRTLPGRWWWGRSLAECPGRRWGWSQTRRCRCTSCAAAPPWGCCARGR